MKYKMVVFDLDGTILNTIGDLCSSVNEALKTYSLPLIDINQTKAFLGFGVKRLVELASNGDERLDELLKVFLKHYEAHYNDSTIPYNGIYDVINYCHDNNIKIGVLTNKVEEIAVDLCNAHFKNDFLFVYGDVVGRNRKPDPSMIYKIMSDYNIEKEEFLYIGDSEVDMKVSVNAGVDCILLTYGFRNKEDLVKTFPYACYVDKAIDIIDYLK